MVSSFPLFASGGTAQVISDADQNDSLRNVPCARKMFEEMTHSDSYVISVAICTPDMRLHSRQANCACKSRARKRGWGQLGGRTFIFSMLTYRACFVLGCDNRTVPK